MSKNSLFEYPIGRSVDITLVNFHGLFKLATERINSNPVHISLHAKNFLVGHLALELQIEPFKIDLFLLFLKEMMLLEL